MKGPCGCRENAWDGAIFAYNQALEHFHAKLKPNSRQPF
jgi:hypothetical protein